MPWANWRHVRHTLYGLDGNHVWAQLEGLPWEESRERQDSCPSVTFEFDDFDGERIRATTKIEEREWRFGTGWFKWLSIFRRPMIRRTLDIDFSAQTGRRKGSWKGGTLGHGINMLPREAPVEAFQRYCAEHEMTFIGIV